MEYTTHSISCNSNLHAKNEDSFLCSDNYIIIADGMGGESDGDIASQIAVDSMISVITPKIECTSVESEIKKLSTEAILYADSKIAEYIDKNPDSFGMGTTVLLAIRKNNLLYISWCGDSHCYVYKDRKVSSITKDHSYVQQLIDSGHITVEESFNHPNNNLITRFVGGGSETCIPDFCTHPISESEMIIFCSDGLSGYCKTEDICKTIQKNKNLQDLPQQLSELAISHGSDDDITIIVLTPKSYVNTGRSFSLFEWLRKK